MKRKKEIEKLKKTSKKGIKGLRTKYNYYAHNDDIDKKSEELFGNTGKSYYSKNSV